MSDEKKQELAQVPKPDQVKPAGPQDLFGTMFAGRGMPACTFRLDTPEGRELLQKCEEDTDEPVRELVNKVINLVHIYAKDIDLVNKETGEVQPATRICLIDADGSVHGCVSTGVFEALRRIVSSGRHWPFNPPIKVQVKLKGLGNGRQRLTLLEVFDKPKGGAK